MTDLDKHLEATWGPAAQHSEHTRNDVIRYRVNDAIYTGTIIWIAGPRESHRAGRGMFPLRYVVTRQGWSGLPDVACRGWHRILPKKSTQRGRVKSSPRVIQS